MLKDGMSIVKFRLLPDSLFQLDAPFVSTNGKWKLAAQTELDGLVSEMPIACSQTQRRKVKYSVFDGSHFESWSLCLVDSDRDGAFDKSFETGGFDLRWRTFEQEVNDSRSSDKRIVVNGIIPPDAASIKPVRYTKFPAEKSNNILYLNVFYAGEHALVSEFSLGFCIDYKALEKSCPSLRPITFYRSFKKSEAPLRVTMIGTDLTIQRVEGSQIQIGLDRVPDKHQIAIISNPFSIE